MDPYVRPTWAEISLDALRHNILAFREAVPKSTRMMAVVKANAYGHGAIEVAQEAIRTGVEYIGVSFLDEAIQLRRAGIMAPILVLGYTPPEAIAEAYTHGISLTIYSEDSLIAAESLPKDGRPLLIHIKIDTGMGRIGLHDSSEAIRFIERALRLEHVVVEGLFTHYARADEQDKHYTELQYQRMQAIVDYFESRGVTFPYVHAGNSAAAIDLPDHCFNMVRLGIGMYGLYPSAEVNQHTVALKPMLKLASKVIMVKTVPADTPISYGGTYKTDAQETIATLPVGYGDGFSRMLSGRAEALIGGKKVPVVGRICMDQCMINVTGIDVSPGEEAVLIGRQGDEEITADELAAMLNTINYEIVCMISNRVPRVYIRDGKPWKVTNPLLDL